VSDIFKNPLTGEEKDAGAIHGVKTDEEGRQQIRDRLQLGNDESVLLFADDEVAAVMKGKSVDGTFTASGMMSISTRSVAGHVKSPLEILQEFNQKEFTPVAEGALEMGLSKVRKERVGDSIRNISEIEFRNIDEAQEITSRIHMLNGIHNAPAKPQAQSQGGGVALQDTRQDFNSVTLPRGLPTITGNKAYLG